MTAPLREFRAVHEMARRARMRSLELVVLVCPYCERTKPVAKLYCDPPATARVVTSCELCLIDGPTTYLDAMGRLICTAPPDRADPP